MVPQEGTEQFYVLSGSVTDCCGPATVAMVATGRLANITLLLQSYVVFIPPDHPRNFS